MILIKDNKVNKIPAIHLHLRNNQENLLIHRTDTRELIIITSNHKELPKKDNLSNNKTNRSNVLIQIYEFISIEKPFRMTFTKNFKGE